MRTKICLWCGRYFILPSCLWYFVFFFFKQKTAYEMRISDWSSDVCSSDLGGNHGQGGDGGGGGQADAAHPEVRKGHSFLPLWSGSGVRSGTGWMCPARIPRPMLWRRSHGYFYRPPRAPRPAPRRSEEQPSELQSLMRNSYAVICVKAKKINN